MGTGVQNPYKTWLSNLKISQVYMIALFSVAGMIIANQFVIKKLLEERQTDADVINLAGRQRMLSQRIASLSAQATNDFSKIENAKNELQNWRQVHLDLQYGNADLGIPPTRSQDIRALFRELDGHISQISSALLQVKGAESLEEELDTIISNTDEFLLIMEEIVYRYQEESKERIAELIRLELLLAFFSILILLLEFLFIFKPITKELAAKHRKLQKLNLSKDRIMATVAHDLRNPLTGIQGMADMLKHDLKDKIDDEQEMMLDIIDESSVRANDLIQELLDIAVIESEDYHLDTEMIHVNEYLMSILSQFIPKAKEKGINLDVSIEDQELTAVIDRQKFSRVIENLISNAMKFTESPGTVKVSGYKENDRILIKVQDSGIGIPEEMQGIIFDKFSKARRLGLQGENSTGLGMSIVKQVVEMHKGKIWLESESNKGTTFYISIPTAA